MSREKPNTPIPQNLKYQPSSWRTSVIPVTQTVKDLGIKPKVLTHQQQIGVFEHLRDIFRVGFVGLAWAT